MRTWAWKGSWEENNFYITWFYIELKKTRVSYNDIGLKIIIFSSTKPVTDKKKQCIKILLETGWFFLFYFFISEALIQC